jgi:3-dehydroquinate synthase
MADITRIPVSLGDRSYPIHLGAGALALLPRVLSDLPARGTVGVVTDAHVAALYGDRVVALVEQGGRRCALHTLPPGEEHKRLARIEEICGAFLAAGLDRSSVIVALGGGVVGDMAGFAAAVFMRGIPFVQIPTTIVAQVDSSVGGKTGVNHPLSKNSIGAFHQPAAVLVDVSLLESLPARELRAGLAEAIKHGIIADADLFEFLERESARVLAMDREALLVPVRRSCEIKAAIVAADETEQGVRANLNYGHTFGHAFEAVTEYRAFLHGEAIALGMCAAGALAQRLGMVDAEFVRRQEACFTTYGLPTRWADLPVDACIGAMRKDKKVRAGAMKFILADRMGNVVQRTDIAEADVRAALDAVRGGA